MGRRLVSNDVSTNPPLMAGHQLPFVNKPGRAVTAALDVILKPAAVT
jgi:hypothetical protein